MNKWAGFCICVEIEVSCFILLPSVNLKVLKWDSSDVSPAGDQTQGWQRVREASGRSGRRTVKAAAADTGGLSPLYALLAQIRKELTLDGHHLPAP